MRARRTALISLFFSLFVLAGTYAKPLAAPKVPSALEPHGSWSEVSGERLLRFERDRIVVRVGGYVCAVSILSRGPGELTVRNQGLREVWKVGIAGKALRIEQGGKAVEYRPLPSPPPELDLAPLPLGRPAPLSVTRLQEIQGELLQRRDLDQLVRKDPAQKGRWEAVDRDNIAYLKNLVAEVGWIDTSRFGRAASSAAVLMAKHSSDPRLLQAIFPLVEKDVKAGSISAELFSILYDEIALTLGRKQRYGTQLGADEKGPFALPLEDPARVNELRREIGLPPLAEYLAAASEALYNGKEVRVLADD